MKTFTVTIVETLSRAVDVQAETWEEALHKVKHKYNTEDIVLTADDWQDTDFNVFEKVGA